MLSLFWYDRQRRQNEREKYFKDRRLGLDVKMNFLLEIKLFFKHTHYLLAAQKLRKHTGSESKFLVPSPIKVPKCRHCFKIRILHCL